MAGPRNLFSPGQRQNDWSLPWGPHQWGSHGLPNVFALQALHQVRCRTAQGKWRSWEREEEEALEALGESWGRGGRGSGGRDHERGKGHRALKRTEEPETDTESQKLNTSDGGKRQSGEREGAGRMRNRADHRAAFPPPRARRAPSKLAETPLCPAAPKRHPLPTRPTAGTESHLHNLFPAESCFHSQVSACHCVGALKREGGKEGTEEEKAAE